MVVDVIEVLDVVGVEKGIVFFVVYIFGVLDFDYEDECEVVCCENFWVVE